MNKELPTIKELPPSPPGRSGWPWTEASAGKRDVVLPSSPGLRVSIITPSYNQAQFIEETIRSVLLQDYAPIEYIVVDGGSTDGTVEILRRYEGWLSWVSEPDRGQTDAINKGLRMSTGDLLAYLNSDDILLADGVRTMVDYIYERPELGLAYGACVVVDEAGRVMGTLPRRSFHLQRTIERGEFLPQQATFWRREAMKKVGLFDDTLHYAMDYEYFIRIAKAFPVGHFPETIAAFRMQTSSKTVSQSDKHWREALMVSERYGLRPWQPWYWIRRLRHWGLRILPNAIQRRVRRRLNRAQDPHLYLDRA